jgi:MFS family permease
MGGHAIAAEAQKTGDGLVSEGLGRDVWLLAVCASRIFLYANFMVYAACLAVVRDEWNMSATEAGTISSAFMLAYAASLVLFSWLADRLGAKRVVRISAVLSALFALLFAFGARSYASGLVLYALAALPQGGVYTPLVMLFAERYEARVRGRAMGWLIASTSVGYAFSLGVSGVMLLSGGYELAFIVTGLLPALGAAILCAALKDTPNRVHPRDAKAGLIAVLRRSPDARRLIAGYTAHCWELLGMWAWLPAFLAASMALAGTASVQAAGYGAYLSGALHLVGAIAAFSMGRLSDRLGRRAVLVGLALIGAAMSLSIGWLVAFPVWLLLVLGLVYSFAAIGDSPVLSTALTEATPPSHLGSALALRSLFGFGAGAISPSVFGSVLDLAQGAGDAIAWGSAFAALGLGGLVATFCALRLGSRAGGRSD